MALLIAGYRWLQVAVAMVADFDQVLKSQTTMQTRTELAGLSLVPADLILRLMPHFVPHVYQRRRAAQDLDDITGSLQPGC